MRIKLSPQYRTEGLAVARSGDVLTINGVDYDFGPLPNGATLPPGAVGCEFIVGQVDRIEGEVHLTLILPIQRSVFMEEVPDIINPNDGPINLPIIMEEADD